MVNACKHTLKHDMLINACGGGEGGLLPVRLASSIINCAAWATFLGELCFGRGSILAKNLLVVPYGNRRRKPLKYLLRG